MTAARAEATGLLTSVDVPERNGRCNADYVTEGDAPVFLSTELGIASITAYAGLATPEGIKLGSAAEAVKGAYPDWRSLTDEGLTGRGLAKVPGNRKAYYNISITDGEVSYLQLQLREQDCYE